MAGNGRGRYWCDPFVSVTFSMETLISICPTRDPFNLSGGKKKDIVTYSLSDGDCHLATGQVIKLNKWPALPANMWEKVTHSRPLFIYFFFQMKQRSPYPHSGNRIWSSFKDLSSILRTLYQKIYFFADCQINAPALMPHTWCGKVFNHSVPPPTIIQLPFS